MILRTIRAASLLLLAALPAAGCGSLGGLAGAATGTVAAVRSGNPAVGAANGVGTRAVADYGIATQARR